MTHTDSRHRHSGAHVRFHRDRVPAARAARYRAIARDVDLPVRLGQLEDEQALLGCRRPGCGVCPPSKRWYRTADRLAEEAAWRRLDERAW